MLSIPLLLFFCFLPFVLCTEDYYKLLAIDKHASDREIKKAYRTLSKKYHPDKNPGNESAHEKFVSIAEAYDVLSESETRKIYDQYGHEGVKQHKQGGNARQHDPFDLFSRFFGGSGHFGGSGQRKGQDMEVRISVPLKDFYNGAEHEFTLSKQHVCDECEGSGSADGKVHTCNECGGRGAVVRKHMLAPGIFQQVQMGCDKCGGKGQTIKTPCKVCGGSRVVRRDDTHTLTVEKGMPKGARVVYENEADESPDWVAGDLVVTIFEKDAELDMGVGDEERVDGTFFRRKGRDMFWKEVLSLREAWMGDWTRNLTHLDGHVVQLKRKRGEVVQPGMVEVIKGEGMPVWMGEHDHVEIGEFGNLLVEYVVILPDQMESGMEKEFWGVWEKWRKKKGVDLEKDLESIWAAAPSTTRGQPTPLSSDPKGERIAYASNKSIFLRSIDNPAISKQYSAHTTTTTVARFSSSGYYVASGDVSGTVKVWDCVGEGSTKGEYHIIGGRINDIAWDGDSARIIAVGDGKEKFGHCITADSGNSVGEISGHSSQINAVSIRQQRPLRAATGSDDTSLVFYHGAPFKFNTSLRKHNRFVYGVAFSPDGSTLASVGADRKIFLYDGKTGEVKGEIGTGDHKGSIFGVSWAQDSKHFVTSSADQTVKVWDVEMGKAIQTWRMGEEGIVSIPDHQVGVVWPSGRSDGLIISSNLAGDLNYLINGSKTPQRVVQAHRKNITSIATSTGQDKTLFTGSSDGQICFWDISTGLAKTIDGEAHTNYVAGLATSHEGRIFSVGWDDSLRSIDASAKQFTGTSNKTDGQPKGVAISGGSVFLATHKGLEVFKGGEKHKELKTGFSPSAIAASNMTVAVGGDDNKLHLYSTSLDPYKDIGDPSSLTTALTFSPKGDRLAVGFSSGKILVYNCEDWTVAISRWSSHTGRVTSIAWNSTGTHAASGGLDTNIFVWSVAKPGSRVNALNAHKDGVNGIAWVDGDAKVVSVGGDAAVKLWKVENLP